MKKIYLVIYFVLSIITNTANAQMFNPYFVNYEGYGTMYFTNYWGGISCMYQGYISKGRPNGTGYVLWVDGSFYYGGFREGFAHGNGVIGNFMGYISGVWNMGNFVDQNNNYNNNNYNNTINTISEKSQISNRTNNNDIAAVDPDGYKIEKLDANSEMGHVLLGKISTSFNSNDTNSNSNCKEIKYNNGTYKGYITNGVKTKYGKYKWNSGSEYIGQWNNNNKNGYGIYSVFDGYYVSNCPKCKYYVGSWKDDHMEGKGTCYDETGKLIYYGEFRDSKPINSYPTDGYLLYKYETIKYSEGDKYIGEIYKGKREGYGVYYWRDGSYWYGQWKDDTRNGNGVYFQNDGSMIIGKWINDKKQ